MAAEADQQTYVPEPKLTGHCRDRYHERVPEGAVTPAVALSESIPDAGIVEHPHFCEADRVWCYTGRAEGEWFTVVFVEADNRAVTCWLAGECWHSAVGEYLAVRGMEGLIREH